MECSRGWTERCPNATGDRCDCRCGGDHHGTAHGPSLTERRHARAVTKAMDEGDRQFDFGVLYTTLRPGREAGDPDEVLYIGTVRGPLDVTIRRMPEDYELDKRLDLVNHSPTGFQWGYGGSGPAQSALAILADYLGNDAKAVNLHQDFKWAVIAKLPQETPWELTRARIADAIRTIKYRRAEGVVSG